MSGARWCDEESIRGEVSDDEIVDLAEHRLLLEPEGLPNLLPVDAKLDDLDATA